MAWNINGEFVGGDSTTGSLVSADKWAEEDSETVALVPPLKRPRLDEFRSGSTDYTLPLLDGNIGDALITNGSGVLGWADPSGPVVPTAPSSLATRSTGLITGGLLSTDGTLLTVTSGLAAIVDSTTTPPTITEISFAEQIFADTFVSTNPVTYVSINDVGTVSLSTIKPDSETHRELVFIGLSSHPLLDGSIASVSQEQAAVNQPAVMIHDLYSQIGFINVQGNTLSRGTTGFAVSKSSGSMGGYGLNYANNVNDPNNLPLTALVDTTIQIETSLGVVYATTSTLNPNVYESAPGVISTLSNNRWQAMRVYIDPNNVVHLQYGQDQFTSEVNAISSINTSPFITNSNLASNAMLIGYIVQPKNAISLDVGTFLSAGKFGSASSESSGGVLSTLQSTYDNSINKRFFLDTDTLGFTDSATDDILRIDGLNNRLSTQTTANIGEVGGRFGTVYVSSIDSGGSVLANLLITTYLQGDAPGPGDNSIVVQGEVGVDQWMNFQREGFDYAGVIHSHGSDHVFSYMDSNALVLAYKSEVGDQPTSTGTSLMMTMDPFNTTYNVNLVGSSGHSVGLVGTPWDVGYFTTLDVGTASADVVRMTNTMTFIESYYFEHFKTFHIPITKPASSILLHVKVEAYGFTNSATQHFWLAHDSYVEVLTSDTSATVIEYAKFGNGTAAVNYIASTDFAGSLDINVLPSGGAGVGGIYWTAKITVSTTNTVTLGDYTTTDGTATIENTAYNTAIDRIYGGSITADSFETPSLQVDPITLDPQGSITYDSAIVLNRAVTTGINTLISGTSSYLSVVDTEVFKVRIDGNVLNTLGVYGTLSDRDLKTNITTSRDGYLDELLQVRICSFSFKNNPDEQLIGVIAQEVEEIFPRLVSIEENGVRTVKMSIFTPILIKAVQEQQKIITAQEEKIQEQQTQIDLILQRLLVLENK